MVNKKIKSWKTSKNIIVLGIVGEIALGIIWFIALDIIPSLFPTHFSNVVIDFQTFLITMIFTSLVVALVSSILYYRKTKSILTPLALLILLTAFGVFVEIGLTVEVGFMIHPI